MYIYIYVYIYIRSTCRKCIKAKYGCFMIRLNNNIRPIAFKETSCDFHRFYYDEF